MIITSNFDDKKKKRTKSIIFHVNKLKKKYYPHISLFYNKQTSFSNIIFSLVSNLAVTL